MSLLLHLAVTTDSDFLMLSENFQKINKQVWYIFIILFGLYASVEGFKDKQKAYNYNF